MDLLVLTALPAVIDITDRHPAASFYAQYCPDLLAANLYFIPLAKVSAETRRAPEWCRTLAH